MKDREIDISNFSLQPSVMLKIWTEEFLSVSISWVNFYSTLDENNARDLVYLQTDVFSDYIKAGSEIYSTALPRSRWKKLRAEYETRGRLC